MSKRFDSYEADNSSVNASDDNVNIRWSWQKRHSADYKTQRKNKPVFDEVMQRLNNFKNSWKIWQSND